MKKLTYEYVKAHFEAKNCTLLSTDYIDSTVKLEYICSCGNKDSVFWGNFQRYGRCKKCSVSESPRKFTQKEVGDYFSEQGCQLIGAYIEANSPVEYLCKCGSKDTIRFSKFKLGQRCRECKYKKIAIKLKARTGPSNPRWIADRDKVKQNKAFHARFRSMVVNALNQMGTSKENKSQELVGYSAKTLLDHLFGHPDWNSVKDDKWSIDHIFPIKAFLDYGLTDQKLIHCLDNLRPMILKENIRKSGKYSKLAFEKWLAEKGVINGESGRL